MPDNAAARQLADMAHLFKAFANPVRLRLLALLSQVELCSCHVHRVLEISEAAASRQLRYLRRIGLVATSQGRQWTYYHVANGSELLTRRLLELLRTSLGMQPVLQLDLQRLQSLQAMPGEPPRCGGPA